MEPVEQLENTSTLSMSEAQEQAVRVNVNNYEVTDLLELARKQDERAAGLA